MPVEIQASSCTAGSVRNGKDIITMNLAHEQEGRKPLTFRPVSSLPQPGLPTTSGKEAVHTKRFESVPFTESF